MTMVVGGILKHTYTVTLYCPCADLENSTRGDPDNILVFFSHQHISQRTVRTSFEKQLDPKVQLLLEGGPY